METAVQSRWGTHSNIRLAACAVALAVSSWALPSVAAVRLQHEATRSAPGGYPLPIEVVVVGDITPEQVATADIIVVSTDARVYLPLTLSRNIFSAEIPAEYVRPPALEYFLRIVDAEGLELVLPPGAPKSSFFSVAIYGEDEGAAPTTLPDPDTGVEILSPLPEAVVPHATPDVAALFDPPLEAPWDAFVSLDGVDVTDEADVSGNFFVLAVSDSLARGRHDVVFVALTAARRVEVAWTFYVRERIEEQPAWDAWAVVRGAFDDYGAPGFQVNGRLEVGWAVVVAETTATESTSVFLPYEETSMPTMDIYASGYGADASFLLTAQYDPVYDTNLSWSLSGKAHGYEAHAGEIYPSLSGTTLDWAIGEGASVSVPLGRTRTEVVAMRMSEADTAGGFGIYSRFALGAKETVEWGEGGSASLVYVYAFDREASVPDDQKLGDPLRNHVVAAVASSGTRGLVGDVEVARSDAYGDIEGSGTAVRVGLGYEGGADARVRLEYVASDTAFYSAGSFEYDPGESGLRTEFSLRPTKFVRLSGSAGAFRYGSSAQGVDPDGNKLEFYLRADATHELSGGTLRSYVLARHDRIPYESYDYIYWYGTAGASYRKGAVRATASASVSRSETDEFRDVLSLGGELYLDIVPDRLSVRANGRFSEGTSDSGESDYVRTTWIADTSWQTAEFEIFAEYRLLERDDRSDPTGSYTEHIFRIGAGKSF